MSLNGKTVTTLWGPPYRADITSLVNAGLNQFEIRLRFLKAILILQYHGNFKTLYCLLDEIQPKT